ncbi:MAG TPA: cystathionine gamma-synthase, partial [Pseudomonas oleovorans]|nr:cystathionine gamma-synthase [Pseudomonas oleovorans]
MSRYRSLFSWLMLPLLALGSLAALAEPLDGAAQALHMLGYIGADYPATVADGQVVDAGEYREQLEFIGVLQGLVVALPAKAERVELEQGIAALKHAVEQRQPGADVAHQARQLSARLAELYQVAQTPAITPDPERGAPLYAQHCSVCHGDAGAGDGPAGIGLEPP